MKNNDNANTNLKTLNRKEEEMRCGEKSEASIAAFRRSSLMMRSPPTGSTTNPGDVLIGKSRVEYREVLLNSPATQQGPSPLVSASPVMGEAVALSGRQTPATSVKRGSPRMEMIHNMRKMEEDAIAQCKETLSSMQSAVNRQKNISNDVKTGISKMAELLDVMMNFRRTWKEAERERELSDLRRNAATLQSTDVSTPKSGNSKRAATSPVVAASGKRVRAEKQNVSEGVESKKIEEGWQTVRRKREKRKKAEKKKADGTNGTKITKPRPRPLKPEAIVVRPTEGRSYAEVLKNLRAKMMTDETAKVRSIRKTTNGAILLELGKGEKVEQEFVKKLRDTVRETACVAELKPTATVEIRDLDSLTEKEEVETAVRKLLANGEEQLRTRITAPNAREQVRVYITLSAESAAKLIEIGSIRIGFVQSKVRICEEIRKCYRCLASGHLQSNCSGPDRRNVCFRCGESGHKMDGCKAAPRCINCVDAKRAQTDHMMGSRRCPQIQK